MNKFRLSETSEQRLNTCSWEVIQAVHWVLHFIDVGVLEGHRDQATQDRYFMEDKSKVKWPDSDHNAYPSNAVDLVIFVKGIGYINEKTSPEKYLQYYGYLAGLLRAYCEFHELEFTWGGDWDGDADMHDQRFDDLVHFSIRKRE